MFRGLSRPAFAISIFTTIAATITFGDLPAAAGNIGKDDITEPKTRLLFYSFLS